MKNFLPLPLRLFIFATLSFLPLTAQNQNVLAKINLWEIRSYTPDAGGKVCFAFTSARASRANKNMPSKILLSRGFDGSTQVSIESYADLDSSGLSLILDGGETFNFSSQASHAWMDPSLEDKFLSLASKGKTVKVSGKLSDGSTFQEIFDLMGLSSILPKLKKCL